MKLTGEQIFALDCKARRLKPLTEYKFHPERRWRFDFYFLEQRVAVEVEGGTWAAGRHTRGSGYAKDCEKCNAAAEMGITVLRYTTQMVESGEAINQVVALLERAA